MSQRVYSCACGWRGLAVDGAPCREGRPPSACPQCGASAFTVSSETHPQITRTCEDCRQTFEGLRTSRYCQQCRWRHRKKPVTTYHWTPERDALLRARYDSRVKGRAAEIAQALDWPKWVITHRAVALGLSYAAPQSWTPQEEAFLAFHAGHRTTHWMAKTLKRSQTAVIVKLKRLQISRAMRNGYGLRDLEACFGVDHHQIERWVEKGWLKKRQLTPGLTKSKWLVKEIDILRFIRAYPMAFRLDKVDQLWFLDVVLTSPSRAQERDDDGEEDTLAH